MHASEIHGTRFQIRFNYISSKISCRRRRTGSFFRCPKSIDFSKNILPDFVESIYGFSSPEKIGRWTNADIARVIFRDPLPKILRIEVLARANGFNINQPILVVVGSDAHIFWPKSFEPHSYELVFNCRAPGRMIEFFVPHAISQQHLTGGQSSDSRRIGLGIHSITVGKTQLPSVRKKGFLSSLLGRFRHASMVS